MPLPMDTQLAPVFNWQALSDFATVKKGNTSDSVVNVGKVSAPSMSELRQPEVSGAYTCTQKVNQPTFDVFRYAPCLGCSTGAAEHRPRASLHAHAASQGAYASRCTQVDMSRRCTRSVPVELALLTELF